MDDHTYYGFWVRDGKTDRWTHLVTMDVATSGAYLQGGTDSFIEDWLETGKNARTTHLRNGWKRKPDGEWHAFGRARYSVNSWDLTEGKRSFNFRTNWNAGVAEDAGGKFYFAKDLVIGYQAMMASFPTDRREDFLALKRSVDPDELLQTDLWRRVFTPSERFTAPA